MISEPRFKIGDKLMVRSHPNIQAEIMDSNKKTYKLYIYVDGEYHFKGWWAKKHIEKIYVEKTPLAEAIYL